MQEPAQRAMSQIRESTGSFRQCFSQTRASRPYSISGPDAAFITALESSARPLEDRERP